MFNGAEILHTDEFEGPLTIVANITVDTVLSKYPIKPVSYGELPVSKPPPYPEAALREAILNALVHNDYSSHVPIQIKVDGDGLSVFNEGGLPPGWTVDKHKSVPRNPLLANAFFRAGMVGLSGNGMGKILSEFEGRSIEGPEFDFTDGFGITFAGETAGILPRQLGRRQASRTESFTKNR